MNCAGFVAHKDDIKMDRKLLKGNIIHLLETSIPSTFDNAGLEITNKRNEFFNVGKGKGIASFIQEGSLYKVIFKT